MIYIRPDFVGEYLSYGDTGNIIFVFSGQYDESLMTVVDIMMILTDNMVKDKLIILKEKQCWSSMTWLPKVTD